MPTFPETILVEVKKAYKATRISNDFVSEFSCEIEKIIKARCSTSHFEFQDIHSDVAFLCKVYKDNELAGRQLIKLVTDYVRRSLEIDPMSRQDETQNITYMKSIRN